MNLSYIAQIALVVVTYYIYDETIKPVFEKNKIEKEVNNLKGELSNTKSLYKQANNLSLLSFKNEMLACWGTTFRPPYNIENRFERELVLKLTSCAHSKLNTSLYFAAFRLPDKNLILNKTLSALDKINNEANAQFDIFEARMKEIDSLNLKGKYERNNQYILAYEKCSAAINSLFNQEIETIHFN